MARRIWNVGLLKLLIICGALLTISSLYLALAPIAEPCNCAKDAAGSVSAGEQRKVDKLLEFKAESRAHRQQLAEQEREYLAQGDHPLWGPHKLAVIVPFRNRFEELIEFVPHMHKFLNAQKVRHKIFIINQADKLRFNRASLINIGVLQSSEECDYIAMHDVDLLPLNPNLSYQFPAKGPLHLSGPELHPKYHYKTFVGGILLLTVEQFQKCNGLSNRFWGWGREDDEFYVRMIQAKLQIYRPKNITTGYDTFKHVHDKIKRPRDYKRYTGQKEAARYRDYSTGLSTVTHESLTRHEVSFDGAPATIINVELACDTDETPWCMHPDQLRKQEEERRKNEAMANAEAAAVRHRFAKAKEKMAAAQAAVDRENWKKHRFAQN